MIPPERFKILLDFARNAGAILLAATLCLPMSRCTATYDAHGQLELLDHKPGDIVKTDSFYLLFVIPQTLPSTEKIVAAARADIGQSPNLFSPYFIIPGFIWPLGIILLSGKPRLARWRLVGFCMNWISIAYAGLITFAVGHGFSQPLLGFYTGCAGVVLSGVAWILDVVLIIRGRITRNRFRAA